MGLKEKSLICSYFLASEVNHSELLINYPAGLNCALNPVYAALNCQCECHFGTLVQFQNISSFATPSLRLIHVKALGSIHHSVVSYANQSQDHRFSLTKKEFDTLFISIDGINRLIIPFKSICNLGLGQPHLFIEFVSRL